MAFKMTKILSNMRISMTSIVALFRKTIFPPLTFLSGDTPEDEGPTADIGIEGVLVQGESDPISYCGAWLHALHL